MPQAERFLICCVGGGWTAIGGDSAAMTTCLAGGLRKISQVVGKSETFGVK